MALLAYFLVMKQLFLLMKNVIFILLSFFFCRHVRRSSSRSETQTSRPRQAPECGGSFPLQLLPTPGPGHRRRRRRFCPSSECHSSPHREPRPEPRWQSQCGPRCGPWCGPRCGPWRRSHCSTQWRSRSWRLSRLQRWIHFARIHWYRHDH